MRANPKKSARLFSIRQEPFPSGYLDRFAIVRCPLKVQSFHVLEGRSKGRLPEASLASYSRKPRLRIGLVKHSIGSRSEWHRESGANQLTAINMDLYEKRGVGNTPEAAVSALLGGAPEDVAHTVFLLS